MTALIVTASILAFLALLLSFSLTVYVSIKEEISIKIGIFGYKKSIIPSDEKPEKEEKSQKQEKPKQEKPNLEEKKPSEKSFSETVDFVLRLLQSVLPNSKAMFSHLRFTDVRIYMSAAGDNACDAAVNFGRANAGIHTVLGLLASNFKLKLKACRIRSDFVRDEWLYDISFKVKLRLFHILFAALGILIKFVKNFVLIKHEPKIRKV